MILTLRTDKSESEVGLYDGTEKIDHVTWYAHKQLAETIHERIRVLLQKHRKCWDDLSGVVCYKGPGSFTGLRVGVSVVNALAYSLGIPVVGKTGDYWLYSGLHDILDGKNDGQLVPEYSHDAHITQPRK